MVRDRDCTSEKTSAICEITEACACKKLAAFCKLNRSASNRAPRALKFTETPVPPGVSFDVEIFDPEAIRIIESNLKRNASSTALNAFELRLGSIGEIDDTEYFSFKNRGNANF